MSSGSLALGVLLAALPTSRLTALQCPDGSPPPCPAARAAAAPAPNSVAVLYFDNLSRDTADLYLAYGLTEELIDRLARIERLTVKSRTAVQRFRGRLLNDPAVVGRALGVVYLVSGSMRRSRSGLRVTAELTRAATGVRVWGETFHRPAGELLLVETEIAQAIATGIAGRLAPVQHRSLAARPTTSPEAYDHFLRGNFFLAGRDIARAVQEFEVALTVDPRFTQALARIAYGYGTLLDRGLTVNDLPAESLLVRGSAAVERALSLDSSASDAWMADGYIRAFRYPRTFEGVLPALERAITLDPRNTEAHHQYAWMLHLVGRDSAAEAENLRALELDPTRWITCQQLAVGYFTTRRFGEALRWADSAGALEANVYALIQQFWASFFVGDMGRARAAADSIRRVFGDPDLADLVAAVAGDTVARQSTLHYASELTRHTDLGSASDAALRYALLGQPELAIDALERVRSSGLWLWATTRVPGFDALRSNPRFQRLVEQIRPR